MISCFKELDMVKQQYVKSQKKLYKDKNKLFVFIFVYDYI